MLSLLVLAILCALVWRLYRTWPLNWRANAKFYNVVVTGCDSGLGLLVAKRLHKMGVPVIACCLTDEGVRELKSVGVRAHKLDITDQGSINRVFGEVSRSNPEGIWALINNAGIGANSFFDMADTEQFEKVMQVNFFGTVKMIKTFLPLLKKKRGRLIVMSSMSGRTAVPGYGAYGASKAALISLCDTLRLELKRWGVRVINLEPGGISTGFVERSFQMLKTSWESAPDEVRTTYGEDWLGKQIRLITKYPLSSVLSSPETVVDAYIQATLCRFPKAIYVVGSVDTYLLCFLSYLPTWVSDTLQGWTALGM